MKHDRTIWLDAALICTAMVLASCQLVPTERGSTIEQKQRENVGQKAAADFANSVKPDPLRVEIPTEHGPVVISQPVPSESKGSAQVNENSDSSASGKATWYESIPMFVKIIGLAIGLAMLGALFAMAKRSSKAVSASWDVVDNSMAGMIHRVRSEATAEPDATVRAKLTAMAADIERERTNFHRT